MTPTSATRLAARRAPGCASPTGSSISPREAAQKRIAFSLEGRYNLDVLSDGIAISLALRIETGVDACFSADHLVVELGSTGDAPVLRVARAGGVGATPPALEGRPITPAQAERYLAMIEVILARPERTGGGRSTTRYYARVYRPADAAEPQVAVSSADMPRKVLEELGYDPLFLQSRAGGAPEEAARRRPPRPVARDLRGHPRACPRPRSLRRRPTRRRSSPA